MKTRSSEMNVAPDIKKKVRSIDLENCILAPMVINLELAYFRRHCPILRSVSIIKILDQNSLLFLSTNKSLHSIEGAGQWDS